MKLYQIPVDDYFVIVSDEAPNVKDIAFEQYTDGTNAIVDLVDALCLFQHDHLLSRRKVVYQSKPVHDGLPLFVPVGVDEVEELSDEVNGYSVYGKPLGEKYLAFKEGFLVGYKEAKEKYRFTDEDMRKAILKAWDNSEDTKNIDDIIQQLTAPKTYEVELEMEEDYELGNTQYNNFKPKIAGNRVTIINHKEIEL